MKLQLQTYVIRCSICNIIAASESTKASVNLSPIRTNILCKSWSFATINCEVFRSIFCFHTYNYTVTCSWSWASVGSVDSWNTESGWFTIKRNCVNRIVDCLFNGEIVIKECIVMSVIICIGTGLPENRICTLCITYTYFWFCFDIFNFILSIFPARVTDVDGSWTTYNLLINFWGGCRNCVCGLWNAYFYKNIFWSEGGIWNIINIDV